MVSRASIGWTGAEESRRSRETIAPERPGSSNTRSLDGGTFVWNAKVDGWEDVTVPAGRFEALVIRIAGKQSGSVCAQRRTVWYAPAAKWKVKEEWTADSGRWIVSRERWDLQSYELH